MQSGGFKLLSVIVPCFKQEKTIATNLKRIEAVLKATNYDYEVIVVVDGQVDKTFNNAKKVKSKKIKVVGYQENHGKGYALRYGMARSKGDVIAFIDAGQDLNPIGLRMLLAHFEWYDADIIVGSKWHPVSKVKYPLRRKILSHGYSFLAKILFGLKIKDTQLGMKFFRRQVLEKVLPRLLVKKYAIDVEMLTVASRLGYKRIYEAPVELNWSEIESTVSNNLLKTIWDIFLDTLAIFYRLKILRYYDDSSKQKQRYDEDLDFKVNVG